MNTSANTNQTGDTTASTVRAMGILFLRRATAAALLAAAVTATAVGLAATSQADTGEPPRTLPALRTRAPTARPSRGASSASSAAPCATVQYPATAAGTESAPSGGPHTTNSRSAHRVAGATPASTVGAGAGSIRGWSATKPTRCDPTRCCPMSQGIWANTAPQFWNPFRTDITGSRVTPGQRG